MLLDFFVPRESKSASLKQYTKNNVIKELGEDHPFVYDFPNLYSGLLVIIKKSKVSMELLHEWENACLNDELIDGNIVNIDGSKTNNFSFKKIDFDLSQYASKSTSFPKIQELKNQLLIKCLKLYIQGKAKEMNSKILNCNKSSIKNIKEELFKRFYKPIYLPLLSLLACLIFFTSKENNKFIFYKYLIFSSGIIAIVISEISLRYVSNSFLGLYFFIIFPLLIVLFLYIFSYNKSKKNY